MPIPLTKCWFATFIVALLTLWSANASADVDRPPSFAEAEALYVEGKFLPSASMAWELQTAPGLALAARGLLAYATTTAPPEERFALIDRAEELAQQALALDETVVEGHLQLVVAIGHRAKAQGAVMSQIEGLAGKTRSHIDRALELEPDNPWALAISGGWHMELARRDPIGITVLLFGARRSSGMADFERALELDPTNAVLHVQYGLTLLEAKRNKYRDRAIEALDTANTLSPPGVYDQLIQARGRHVLALLDQGDKKTLLQAVRNYNGLNTDNITPPDLKQP